MAQTDLLVTAEVTFIGRTNLAIDTDERQAVTYFTGYEVEHTICYKMFTLFVVGTPPLQEILDKAKQTGVSHVYFGTSQSFNPRAMTQEEYAPWDEVILGCLREGYWVTLDFDVRHAEGVLESGYNEYSKFVSMISVKLPYINQFNYNTTVKLDDRTWGATNPGVWTHQLGDLMPRDKYTYWDQYTQDTVVK
jgi:hypothetical protein